MKQEPKEARAKKSARSFLWRAGISGIIFLIVGLCVCSGCQSAPTKYDLAMSSALGKFRWMTIQISLDVERIRTIDDPQARLDALADVNADIEIAERFGERLHTISIDHSDRLLRHQGLWALERIAAELSQINAHHSGFHHLAADGAR